MMINVVFCFILVTIVSINANGGELKLVVNELTTTWKDAFVFCNDQNYWHQIFNDCQPGTCNASRVADKIINKSNSGLNQYWIYGYVLRSPVIANIGCFSLNASVLNALHRDIFSFEQNSAFECSKACSDNSVDYIFMRGRECLCITKKEFRGQLYKYMLIEENTATCNQSCAGNNGDLCGGESVVDGKRLYNVYQVKTRSTISTTKVGDTCAALLVDDKERHQFRYTTCNFNHMYICERYNKSDYFYEDKCSNETASWYIAKQKCQKQDSQLRPYTTSSFSSKCFRREQIFWIGNHMAERILWTNDSLAKDAFCLKLVITESGNSRLYSLCYKRQHTSSERNDEAYTTTFLSHVNSSTAPRYTLSEVANNQANKTVSAAVNNSTENYVKYLTAASIVLFLGVIIIASRAFCIQRRSRQKLYASFIPPQPQIYSEINTNQYDEITDLDMPQNPDKDEYEMPRLA